MQPWCPRRDRLRTPPRRRPGISARIGVFDNQPTTSQSGSIVTSPMFIESYALAFDERAHPVGWRTRTQG